MVSVEVAGPQESSVGRADKMPDSDIGAMVARQVWKCRAFKVNPEVLVREYLSEVRVVVFSGAGEILAL